MANGLPIIEKKYYETKLPSSDKPIKYHKMNVGQQKEVMLASEDPKQVQNILINIVNDCVDIDVMKIDKTDFLSLGYDLRASSDGHIIKFTYPNVRFITKKDKSEKPEELTYDEVMNPDLFFDVENEQQRNDRVKEILAKYVKKSHTNNFEINIREDLIITDGKYVDNFNLSKTQKMFLKAPTIEQLKYINEKNDLKEGERELFYRMLCIDKVVTEDETYNNFTFDELTSFFDECIDQDDFAKIDKFYKQIPKIVVNKNYKCSKWNDVLVKKGDSAEDFL